MNRKTFLASILGATAAFALNPSEKEMSLSEKETIWLENQVSILRSKETLPQFHAGSSYLRSEYFDNLGYLITRSVSGITVKLLPNS